MRLSTFVLTNAVAPSSRWVRARPKSQIEAFCLILAIITALVDNVTAQDITLDIAYAMPIAIAAWFVGRSGAFLVVLTSLLGALPANGLGFTANVIDTAIHGAFYMLLVVALTRLSHLQRNLERRADYRARALARETAEREKLEQEMIEISEREQRRLGRDLHDGLCQHLLGTAFVGQALADSLVSTRHPESVVAVRLVGLVQQAIRLARGAARGLYPVGIEEDGLMRALEDFAASTSEIFGLSCRFVCHSPVLIHNHATATHLYRVAQEAVSNAIKHGRATEISILPDESEKGILLAVTDDGNGFADAPPRDGMGLKIIADRAKMMGGQFAIAPQAQGGTQLSCWIPHPQNGLGGAYA
jgi:signal transduction histidine kinase